MFGTLKRCGPQKLIYKSAKQAVDHCSDFHFSMLEYIVKLLKSLLSSPGFDWVFEYFGKKYDSVLVKG